MLVDVEYMKSQYCLKIDDNILNECILFASNFAISKVANQEEISTSDQDDKFTIDLGKYHYFFDINLDEEIDAYNDLDIFEYDEDYNKYDLSGNVTSIKEFYIEGKHKLIIEMDNVYPSESGRIIVFKYRSSRINFRGDMFVDKKDLLKKFIGVQTIIELLTKRRGALMQAGMSSWTLNGVSIALDSPGMKAVVDDFRMELKSIYNDMIPIVTNTIRSKYNWVNGRYRV